MGGVRWDILINLGLRAMMAYFMAEVLLVPDDPRFAGKAIPIRNLLIVVAFGLAFPLARLLWKRWARYPWWYDSLFLSIFWLDMAGNSFNLYDTYFYFDLIPHTHGPGALSIVAVGLFGISALGAVGLATIVHVLLEGQEFYTDVFAGTINVRGQFDTVNDLLVGVVGAVLYVVAFWLLTRNSGRVRWRLA